MEKYPVRKYEGLEIDREALADKIMEINFESYGFSHEEVAYKTADKIISTMPTWLKRIER